MNTFAAIDFETANAKRSSVCSLGLVVVEDRKVVASVHRLIRPRPNFYSKHNTRVHGMTLNDTERAPDFPSIWDEVIPLIKEYPLVAHNSPFDEGCLKAVFELYGMTYPGYEFLCTYRAARRSFPNLVNHRLPSVAAQCGYNLSNHHHALADAEACAAIALTIL